VAKAPDLVEQKIAAAEACNIKLGASSVSLTEGFYITNLSQGKARVEEFVTVHKDSEFEPLKGTISLQALPYKPSTKRAAR
jgi:hypothetical protein